MPIVHRIILTGASVALVFATQVGCEATQNARGAKSIFAIGKGPTPGEAATSALDKYDPAKRAEGTLLLANAPWGGEDPYVELYVDAVKDPDANVRIAGLRGLARHGSPENAEIIAACLFDENVLVRREAARALQRIHNPEVVPSLLVAIREPDPSPTARNTDTEKDAEVRAAAANALGQYAENRVVVGLIDAMADSQLSVNYNALESLRTLTGQNLGYDQKAWQEWYSGVETAFAARQAYEYPVFQRDAAWYEYLPLVPSPPNEPEDAPVGFPKEIGG